MSACGRFETALRKNGLAIDPHEIDEIFDRLDTDASGELDAKVRGCLACAGMPPPRAYLPAPICLCLARPARDAGTHHAAPQEILLRSAMRSA